MNATGTDRCDLTETKAETPLELGVKFGVRQRDDARRLLRLLGPDDGRAVAHGGVAFQRQDRERPGGGKMLLRPPPKIAPRRDGGDNRPLLLTKTLAGEFPALADNRNPAVRGHEKTRSPRVTLGEA